MQGQGQYNALVSREPQHGTGANGQELEEEYALENLSFTNLYVQL